MAFNITEKLKVPETEGSSKATRWINRDIAPLKVSRRTWNTWTYLGFWNTGNFTAASYSGGSSLVSLGLSIPSTVGVLMIAKVFTVIAAVLNGWVGAKFHIGYTVGQRQVFGVFGSALGISMRIILGVVWYGSNAWMGGLCLGTILSTIFPTFQNMKNTFPEGVNMTTKELVGFLLYQLLCMVLLRIRPEKVAIPIAVSAGYNFFVMLAMVIWARVHAGTIGPLVHTTTTASGSELAWIWLYGITSTFGGIVTGIANQSDFTRFSIKRTDPILGTFLGLWFFSTLVPVIGIITTSCLQSTYGEQYWNPIYVVQLWLATDYSAKSRAAGFFASLGFTIAQIGNSVVENGIPGGMDLAGCFPEYINIFRGSIIIALLSWIVCPWTFYNTSSTFVTVMGSFSVFMTPLIGILICDFWIVRKRKIKLADLYHGESSGAYYFTYGCNFRALAAWTVAFTLNLPGMIHNITPSIKIGSGMYNYFRGNLFFGLAISVSVYYVLCRIWPIEEAGILDECDHFGTWTTEESQVLGIIPYEQVKGTPDDFCNKVTFDRDSEVSEIIVSVDQK
ncbi:hypothetical protein KL930_004388 [Ogataea haglerorum]|uniref:Allantoin permease n=1 Tax=Ogataea haglerorum TaxID=1937702 RepID=A0AAN6D2X2_9ASCO|nr:hypothetical protein KL915_004495 [Ogataea haglerorum]KAG7704551.1 hypothetical protein KL950_004358 [Ogataea haglerorum]KAG7715829.1 hypothetical protein KL913_003642 [Ogataea haglerorum]KAG7716607.1 hypothetical protein KL949_003898 [Ogataea haglerorum]KAG7725624.1 hypothetical protein KL933_004190 [Ogataea haglerorum]